jgi:copper chaperone
MVTFKVDDMTCGHCASSITKAVQAIDPNAQVKVDLATHRAQIVSTLADTAQLSGAIRVAGYSPVPVEAGAPSIERPAARSGCCCR